MKVTVEDSWEVNVSLVIILFQANLAMIQFHRKSKAHIQVT